ncbi:DUF3152 domain-containing protein [Micromonospora sp. NPDC049559]|uniref:DUF3152 domain-containing protein n=1 Tax=Micromonospora sp. NPDC049559 TaxID=3155923 RepID=UPI003448F147
MQNSPPPPGVDPAGTPSVRERRRRARRRRSRWSAALAVSLLGLAGAVAVVQIATRTGAGAPRAGVLGLASGSPGPPGLAGGAEPAIGRAEHPAAAGTGDPAAGGATPAPGGVPAPGATPLLRLPGPVPQRGAGSFRYGDGPGEVFGRAGALRRYRVAVENGATEEVGVFAGAVDRALSHPASWIGSGRLRLQRVPAGAPYEFTVYLATAQTARVMCAAGGVDIRVGGRPYTSCRAPGKVIINLDRWRASVDHFVAAGIPLDTYRLYVVNHEVGHELGHRHERCPGRGRPAPVMMQQTLFLKGCAANPWPYLDGARYAGPPL